MGEGKCGSNFFNAVYINADAVKNTASAMASLPIELLENIIYQTATTGSLSTLINFSSISPTTHALYLQNKQILLTLSLSSATQKLAAQGERALVEQLEILACLSERDPERSRISNLNLRGKKPGHAILRAALAVGMPVVFRPGAPSPLFFQDSSGISKPIYEDASLWGRTDMRFELFEGKSLGAFPVAAAVRRYGDTASEELGPEDEGAERGLKSLRIEEIARALGSFSEIKKLVKACTSLLPEMIPAFSHKRQLQDQLRHVASCPLNPEAWFHACAAAILKETIGRRPELNYTTFRKTDIFPNLYMYPNYTASLHILENEAFEFLDFYAPFESPPAFWYSHNQNCERGLSHHERMSVVQSVGRYVLMEAVLRQRAELTEIIANILATGTLDDPEDERELNFLPSAVDTDFADAVMFLLDRTPSDGRGSDYGQRQRLVYWMVCRWEEGRREGVCEIVRNWCEVEVHARDVREMENLWDRGVIRWRGGAQVGA